MTRMITLPENWHDLNTERRLVAEGWYTVQVEDVDLRPDGRIHVALSILDEGEFATWSIHESFSLDSDGGARAFKRFIEAISVQPSGLELDPGACKHKVLRVKTRHKTDEHGDTWANVVAHAPDEH